MKKTFILLLILTSSLVFSQVPSFQWAFDFKNSGVADDVETDASGNAYMTGFFRGTMDFDPGAGVFNLTATGGGSNSDVFILKLDPSGNFVWAQQLNNGPTEIGNALKVDAGGNIYITGIWLITANSLHAFVAKLNSTGNILWNQSTSQYFSSGSAQGVELDFDSGGNIYLTGFFDGIHDFDPGIGTYTLSASPVGCPYNSFLWKLNSSGNFIWAKQLISINPSNGNCAQSLSIDNSGDIYYTGYFYDIVDFDPGPGSFTLTTGGPSIPSAFVSKLNSSGNLIWAQQLGNTVSFVSASDIEYDNTSNIFYAGTFAGTIDLDPGSSTFTLNSLNGNCYLSKLDLYGNFIWAKQLGGAIASISSDINGNPYLTGSFSGTGDFDPGPGTYSFTSYGNDDIFIEKLDFNGDFIWSGQIGNSLYNVGNNICVTPIGEIFVVGRSDSTADMDPGPGFYPLVNGTTWPGYILKLGASSTGISSPFVKNLERIYPNPTSGQFNLVSDKIKEKTEIKIFNSLGQIVFEKNILSTDRISLSISNQPSGIYFVEVNTDGEIYREKVVKE